MTDMAGEQSMGVCELAFKYATGRVYGTEQVLDIEVQRLGEWDEFDMATGVASFKDRSRQIGGLVDLLVFKDDRDTAAIGACVLRAYDAGEYRLA